MPVVSGAMIGGLGLAGGVLGDMTSFFGGQQTNQTNMQIAQMNNAFNAQQAALNRQFQAEQSDTAMQRRVADLRAAGLNPLLAVPQGAQAMSGSSAQSAGLPSIQNPAGAFQNAGQVVSGAFSSAVQADLADAQVKNIQQDTALKQARVPYAAAQASSEVDNLRATANQIKSATFLQDAKFDNTVEDTRRLMQNNDFQMEVWQNLVQLKQYETDAAKYGLSSLARDSEFMNGPWGSFIPMLQRLIVPGSQAVANGAGALKDILGSILQFMPSYIQKSVIGPGGTFRGGSISTKGFGLPSPVNP